MLVGGLVVKKFLTRAAVTFYRLAVFDKLAMNFGKQFVVRKENILGSFDVFLGLVLINVKGLVGQGEFRSEQNSVFEDRKIELVSFIEREIATKVISVQ